MPTKQAPAQAATVVGAPVIDRAASDGATSIAFLLTNHVLPAGKITSWSFWADQIGATALLVLAPTADPLTYIVAGSDEVTATHLGLNTFATDINVAAGSVLGFYSDAVSAQVSFDTGAPGDLVR